MGIRSPRAPSVSAASLVLLLSACGGGGGGSSAPSQTAPAITAQPQSLTVTAPATATFTAAANGSPAPTYQWYLGTGAIAGATSASYTTSATSLAMNGGSYTVTATNAAGSVTSNAAVLTVDTLPSITAQPQPATVTAPAAATFTVAAAGNPAPTYQWYLDNTLIQGATSASYTTPATAASQSGGSYTVAVSNAVGSVTSSAATLTVNASTTPTAPTITAQPQPQTVAAPAAATFTVTAGGIPAPTYQWYVGTTLIPGATSASYTTPATATTMSGGTYSVLVSNASGQVASAAATLTVTPATGPLAELFLPTTVQPGDTWMQASVPVQAGLTYVWTILPGTATGAITSGQGTGTIAFSSGSTTGTFQVQVQVTDAAGATATAIRTVTVQGGAWLVKNGAPTVAGAFAAAVTLPSGRVLVAGGQNSSDNPYSNAQNADAELYDPATHAWTPVGSLGTARYYHTITLLPNGTVLVTGGWNTSGSPSALASAELFDPATGVWTYTGSMTAARVLHTATLLPDGQVLVAGGAQGLNGENPLITTELYDPASGTWTATGSLNTARDCHSATLLNNGQVLAAGGWANTGYLASAELYDPATAAWTATGSLNEARYSHSATLLKDGTVLAVEGYSTGIGGSADTCAEVYDPAKGAWTAAIGALSPALQTNTANLLQDGTVLIAGGGPGPYGASEGIAAIYSPGNQTFTQTSSPGIPRWNFTASTLQDGTVLVAGGWSMFLGLSSAIIYTPATGAWTSSQGLGNLDMAWFDPNTPQTLLADGTVLVCGGFEWTSDYGGLTLGTSAVYDPATFTWTYTPNPMNTARYMHTATRLGNGTVLVAGGFATGTGITTPVTELYTPSSQAWSVTGSLNTARQNHTATLLANGQILVVGGMNDGALQASCELYDAGTGQWTPTGSLNSARAYHTATLLNTGQVLVTGGEEASSDGYTCELYDPATGQWTVTGALNTGRRYHTATLLGNGSVLVAGGDPVTATAELFNPTTGVWTATGSMANGRQLHTALLLPNGTVLVAGGASDNNGTLPIGSSEVYDPATGLWTSTGALNTPRFGAVGTLLQDGTVMTAFGMCGDLITELYHP